jgi:gamma-glutamyltranspeptidase / glutathione hydrolase
MNFDYDFEKGRLAFGSCVVASSHPLAVGSALKALARGGNAIDAALAAATTLVVVEPTMNGIGGDLFALVWNQNKLFGLNSSGRSPQKWNLEKFAGLKAMPLRGWDSVTVPGQPKGWASLQKQFGSLSFSKIIEDAVRAARNGFHVTARTAKLWKEVPEDLKKVPDFLPAFWPSGRAPNTGEKFFFPDQANTLEKLAASHCEDFYSGQLADAIVKHAAANGGTLERSDLKAHSADWETPLSVNYGSLTVHELPPNSQGLSTLMALSFFKEARIKFGVSFGTLDYLHLQIECMKLAFAEAQAFISDSTFSPRDPSAYLTEEYASLMVKRIDPSKAKHFESQPPTSGGTVLVTVGDDKGNIVTLIQSNWWGFGSGIVVPGTGISLHNRGSSFVLDPSHPNCVGSGKRPFHTLIPGFITKAGKPFAAFGLMGGTMQAQGHFQLVCRLEDGHENPQQAIDAHRWRFTSGIDVKMEKGMSAEIVEGLKSMGHKVTIEGPKEFGGAQMICVMENGGYVAASDWRKDGFAGGLV